MDGDLVTYELADQVALIGLNRPGKRNAMSFALMESLSAAATRACEEARAAVLFGHGESFSAGLDLTELAKPDLRPSSQKRRHSHAFDGIAEAPIPFVAALNGHVVGAGLEVAAACHIRVAERTARFSLPEARHGIFVGGGGSVRIAGLISVARMQDMMLTGRVVTGDQIESWNLAQYLTEPGEALDKARAIAEAIARNPPAVNDAIVNGLPAIGRLAHDQGLFVEQLICAKLLHQRAADPDRR